jgi:hypothetical protein
MEWLTIGQELFVELCHRNLWKKHIIRSIYSEQEHKEKENWVNWSGGKKEEGKTNMEVEYRKNEPICNTIDVIDSKSILSSDPQVIWAGADPGFILGGVYEEIGHAPKNLWHHHHHQQQQQQQQQKVLHQF